MLPGPHPTSSTVMPGFNFAAPHWNESATDRVAWKLTMGGCSTDAHMLRPGASMFVSPVHLTPGTPTW